MIQLFRNILFIFIFILIANQVVKKILLPYAWADNVLTQKIKGYVEPNDQYNTLFLGASLTYRHIDPYIIDSIAHLHGIEIHSYNLAVDAQNFIKILDNFHYSQTIQNPHLEYVFIELSSSMEMYLPALHTVKNFYWIKKNHVLQVAKIIKDYPVAATNKALFGYAYAVSWAENLLNFGVAPDVLSNYFVKKKSEKYFNGKLLNGFYPYTEKPKNPLMGTALEEKVIFEERDILMANPDTIMNAIRSKSLEQYEKGGGKKLVASQLKICIDLIETNRQKGIETIFILPPRARGNYNILLPIYAELPEKNKIDLGNPALYPEFYTVENSFNFFHFNEEGAQLYSHVLGEKIVSLIK
jgi:hypothetical protein